MVQNKQQTEKEPSFIRGLNAFAGKDIATLSSAERLVFMTYIQQYKEARGLDNLAHDPQISPALKEKIEYAVKKYREDEKQYVSVGQRDFELAIQREQQMQYMSEKEFQNFMREFEVRWEKYVESLEKLEEVKEEYYKHLAGQFSNAKYPEECKRIMLQQVVLYRMHGYTNEDAIKMHRQDVDEMRKKGLISEEKHSAMIKSIDDSGSEMENMSPKHIKQVFQTVPPECRNAFNKRMDAEQEHKKNAEELGDLLNKVSQLTSEQKKELAQKLKTSPEEALKELINDKRLNKEGKEFIARLLVVRELKQKFNNSVAQQNNAETIKKIFPFMNNDTYSKINQKITDDKKASIEGLLNSLAFLKESNVELFVDALSTGDKRFVMEYITALTDEELVDPTKPYGYLCDYLLMTTKDDKSLSRARTELKKVQERADKVKLEAHEKMIREISMSSTTLDIPLPEENKLLTIDEILNQNQGVSLTAERASHILKSNEDKGLTLLDNNETLDRIVQGDENMTLFTLDDNQNKGIDYSSVASLMLDGTSDVDEKRKLSSEIRIQRMLREEKLSASINADDAMDVLKCRAGVITERKFNEDGAKKSASSAYGRKHALYCANLLEKEALKVMEPLDFLELQQMRENKDPVLLMMELTLSENIPENGGLKGVNSTYSFVKRDSAELILLIDAVMAEKAGTINNLQKNVLKKNMANEKMHEQLKKILTLLDKEASGKITEKEKKELASYRQANKKEMALIENKYQNKPIVQENADEFTGQVSIMQSDAATVPQTDANATTPEITDVVTTGEAIVTPEMDGEVALSIPTLEGEEATANNPLTATTLEGEESLASSEPADQNKEAKEALTETQTADTPENTPAEKSQKVAGNTQLDTSSSLTLGGGLNAGYVVDDLSFGDGVTVVSQYPSGAMAQSTLSLNANNITGVQEGTALTMNGLRGERNG